MREFEISRGSCEIGILLVTRQVRGQGCVDLVSMVGGVVA